MANFENREGMRYKGEFKKGLFDGLGKVSFPDGRVYEGEFIEGAITGSGIMRYPNGFRFHGDFKNGEPLGDGTLDYPDGGVYEGQFDGYTPHGQGSYRDSDGRNYSGDFNQGTMTGKGLWKFPGGGEYKGQVLDGFVHGKGVFTFPNGMVYSGKFNQGAIQGEGRFTNNIHGYTAKGQFIKLNTNQMEKLHEFSIVIAVNTEMSAKEGKEYGGTSALWYGDVYFVSGKTCEIKAGALDASCGKYARHYELNLVFPVTKMHLIGAVQLASFRQFREFPVQAQLRPLLSWITDVTAALAPGQVQSLRTSKRPN